MAYFSHGNISGCVHTAPQTPAPGIHPEKQWATFTNCGRSFELQLAQLKAVMGRLCFLCQSVFLTQEQKTVTETDVNIRVLKWHQSQCLSLH